LLASGFCAQAGQEQGPRPPLRYPGIDRGDRLVWAGAPSLSIIQGRSGFSSAAAARDNRSGERVLAGRPGGPPEVGGHVQIKREASRGSGTHRAGIRGGGGGDSGGAEKKPAPSRAARDPEKTGAHNVFSGRTGPGNWKKIGRWRFADFFQWPSRGIAIKGGLKGRGGKGDRPESHGFSWPGKQKTRAPGAAGELHLGRSWPLDGQFPIRPWRLAPQAHSVPTAPQKATKKKPPSLGARESRSWSADFSAKMGFPFTRPGETIFMVILFIGAGRPSLGDAGFFSNRVGGGFAMGFGAVGIFKDNWGPRGVWRFWGGRDRQGGPTAQPAWGGLP